MYIKQFVQTIQTKKAYFKNTEQSQNHFISSVFKKLKKWYTDPQTLGLPAGEAGTPTEAILSGRDLVEISGCKGLTVYTEEQIAMRVKEGELSVYGEDLELKLYRGAHIAIMGRIDGIRLEKKGGSFKEEGIGKHDR
ncbi:MAG: YabP/YqfC family sporulation protein [Clostridia bacterium]|nr:YabP/YqfC family sporulation protein [Clostridia bacterium]